jgi:hypothetical protein
MKNAPILILEASEQPYLSIGCRFGRIKAFGHEYIYISESDAFLRKDYEKMYTQLKKNGIVLKDNSGSITVIVYNTGLHDRKLSLYNKSLIYKSVPHLQSKNEIIQNLDLQVFENFDEHRMEEYKKTHLIILNQNQVVYDNE